MCVHFYVCVCLELDSIVCASLATPIVNKKLLKKRLKLVTLSSFNRRGRCRCKPFLHSVVYFHLLLPSIDTPV